MKRHVALGNINLDIYVVVDHIPGPDEDATALELYMGPGGAAANYAVAAARLGHEAYLVGHLGLQGLGAFLLEALEESGVKTDHVVIHRDKQPGIVVILVSQNGERAMATMRGANLLLRGDEASTEADILHIASREPEIVKRATRSISSSFISYDPGGRIARQYGSKLLNEATDLVDLIAVNRVEADLIFGSSEPEELAQKLRGRLTYILLKKGAQGAVLVTREGYYFVEAYTEGRVVDTTGAGDVFISVLNSYIAEGKNISEALRAASIAAGLKIMKRGAQSAPPREEIEKRLSQEKPRVLFTRF